MLNLGIYWGVLSLGYDFIAVPCSAPTPEGSSGKHLVQGPALWAWGYPGVWKRQTAGITPCARAPGTRISRAARETNCWNCTPRPALYDTGDSWPSLCLAQHSDWKDGGMSSGSWHISPVTAPALQVTWHMRWETLQLEWNNNKEDGPSGLEVSLRLIQPHSPHQNHFHTLKKMGHCHRRLFWGA